MAKNIYITLCIILTLSGCHAHLALDSSSGSDSSVIAGRDSTIVEVPVISHIDTTVSIPVISKDSSRPNKLKYKDSSITISIPVVTTQLITVKSRPSIVDIYRSFVGIRESTGHNDGKEVEMMLRHVNLGKGNPWCAASVRTGYDSAGIKTTINGAAASVDNPKNRAYYKGVFLDKPLPGDAWTIWFPKLDGGRIGHCGFYDARLNQMTLITYEGNTNSQNSRDGDGFYKRFRPIATIHSINMWRLK